MTELLGELAEVLKLKDTINSIGKDSIEDVFVFRRNRLKQIGMRAAKIEDGERLSKAIEHLYKKTTFTDLGKLRDRVNELYGGVRCRANDQKITDELALIYELSEKIDSWMTDNERRKRNLHRYLKSLSKYAERWSRLFDGNLFESFKESRGAEIVTNTVRCEFSYFGDALLDVGCSKELVDLVGASEGPYANKGLTGMFVELCEVFKEINSFKHWYGGGCSVSVSEIRAQMGPVLGKIRRTWSDAKNMLKDEMPKDVKWVKYAESLTRSIEDVCTLMRNKHLVLCH